MIIYYNPKLKATARMLRKNSTLAEVILWNELKGKQFKGYDFHRQKPIGDYIVDFYCPRLNLVIEIDGSSHCDRQAYDQKREKYLRSLVLNVLRFNDYDIKTSLAGVLVYLADWIKQKERLSKKSS